MPEGTDLTLALVLTAGGAVASAALVSGVIELLKQLIEFGAQGARLLAFGLSAALVVVAYIGTAVPLDVANGFAGFLAWYGIARLSMAVYDDAKARPGGLRG